VDTIEGRTLLTLTGWAAWVLRLLGMVHDQWFHRQSPHTPQEILAYYYAQ